MTDLELVSKWERLTSGVECGCPTCAQNLLDEMGLRFRVLVQQEERQKEAFALYKKGVLGLSSPGTTAVRKEDILK